MRKIYFFIVAFLAFTNISFGQYTWNGSVSTDYTVAANWLPARVAPGVGDNLFFNPATPIVVDHVPNQTINSITINSGTSTVTLNADNPANVLTISGATPVAFTTAGSILAGDFVTINLSNAAAFTISQGTFGIAPGGNGGKIIINSALTLSGGVLDFDVLGTGGTFITGSITYLTGTFNSINTGAINWAGTATYFHAFNGSGASAIPVSIWSTGSTCSITGMNAGITPPTISANNTFSNFTWDCAAQQSDVDLILPATNLFINGTLSIKRTNNKYLRLAGAAGGSITAGAYDQTSGGGNLMLQSSSGTTTLIVTGTFTHSSGILDGLGNVGSGTAYLNLKGDVTKSSTWNLSSTSSAAQMNIEFSGTAVQTVKISGTWNTTGSGRSNIIISNTLSVALSTGSTLKVYNGGSPTPATCTMVGILSPQNATAVVAYTGICTLIYSGSSTQIPTAAEFPTLANIPTNLTINNSVGVNFPSGFPRTISGTLTLLNGTLGIGGNTLSLTNTTLAAQISYTSGFVTNTLGGKLGRYFPTTTLPTSSTPDARFPFGDGINDRSLYVFFSNPALSLGTAGMIYVSHTPAVGINNSPPFPFLDNFITLDKRTNTSWNISYGTFNINAGPETISLSAVAGNIGSVDFYTDLRLTDGIASYGTWINPNTGTNAVPVTGKSGLVMADINNKNLYIGGGSNNPLIIITFTWTGGGADNNWTTAANWTGAVGYPSASTEIAIINAGARQPIINSIDNISVYQLTVGGGMILTMLPSSVINVFDALTFSGTAVFDPASTFTYAGSSSVQNILDIPYGSLALTGLGSKIFPSSTTVKGSYSVSGATPDVTTNTNTFTYAGLASQNITAVKYYNLAISGNRGGGLITLGPSSSAIVTIDIANNFDVSGLFNYTSPGLSPLSFTTVNFSSASPVTIPGFPYPYAITNTGNGNRTLDASGSALPAHVIYCRAFTRGSGVYTVPGSKVNFFVSGTANLLQYFFNYTQPFYDLEFSGNQQGKKIEFMPGEIYVAGKFTFSMINYIQVLNKNAYFVFNGTADQTIPAFKTLSQTPAFKFPNIAVIGGSRNVYLAGSGTDTIGVFGSFQVPRIAPYNASLFNALATPSITTFSAGNGFIVAGSSVNFSIGSGLIPTLFPSSPGTNNYNNISVTSGTRILESDMTISGNLAVGIDSTTITTTIPQVSFPATIKIGDGGSARVFNVLGNVTASAASITLPNTAQIDLNPGTLGSTTMNVSKSLLITALGQITGTGSSNGTVVFKGILPHNYSSSSTFKNGFVNFTGDGTGSKLTLLSPLDLVRSTTIPGTITVLANDSLDCRGFNIVTNTAYGSSGTGFFNLNAGATLIVANTGGIEGTATNSATGTIINDGTITRNYSPAASYIFKASTGTPFPASITQMANLTIDTLAGVTLNRSIDLSSSITFNNSSGFDLSASDVTLKSTATATARVAPVAAGASVSYGGSGRFNVERNYRGLRRAWYLVTSPLTATGSIFSTWQNGGVYTPNRGTYVTGPTAPALGLDASPQQNVSMKMGSTLAPVTNTSSATLSANLSSSADNLAYFLFVRGDRSFGNFNIYTWNTTTLSSRGKIQINSQTFAASSTLGAFTLIGNPYASPVSVSAATKTNLNVNFWVWDPYLNTTLGGYIVVHLDGSGNVDNITPASPGGLATFGQPLILQSSQAFWVQTLTNGAAQVQFNELNKSAVFNVGSFRQMGDLTKSFRTNLNLVEPNDSIILADGNFVQFDNQFSKGVDLDDALKFGNIKETFGFLRDGKALAIERRPEIIANDTLFFKLTKTTQRNYQFQFVPTNMAGVLTAFLEDSYTNAKTMVSLNATSTFNFTINGDAASAAADRFRIVFAASVAGPLPVTYKSIKAYQQGKDITVDWTVENEINISKYEVEKSTDGTNFTKVNTTTAKGTSGSIDYTFVDTKAVQGNNFYRIKNYNQGGSFDYSRVVVVKLGKSDAGISIYPNPVSGNSIGMSMTNMAQGIYQVRLINTIGQTVMTKRINHSTGNSMETLTPDNQLTTGIYQLEVTAPDKRISSTKVIVQ